MYWQGKGINELDGTFLIPFQQSKCYASELQCSKYLHWVVTCNFSEFLMYDIEAIQEP